MDPSLLGNAQGSPVLLSLVDNSTNSHSQIVFLRSMQQQYGNQGLKFILLGSPDPNWTLDGIPVASDQTPAAAALGFSRPMTFLVDSSGRLIQQWPGFVPAQNLGLAIQGLLGLWQFGNCVIPSPHLPLKRIVPIRPHAPPRPAGAPATVSR